MIHDIAHCNGDGCTPRNKCQRYKAHLEAVTLKLRVNYLQADTCVKHRVPHAWFKPLKVSV